MRDNKAVAFLGCIGLIALIPLGIAAQGIALCVLWNWFAVPILHLPHLGIASALGVRLVAHSMTHEDRKEPKETKQQELWITLAMLFVGPALAIALGYLVRLFL